MGGGWPRHVLPDPKLQVPKRIDGFRPKRLDFGILNAFGFYDDLLAFNAKMAAVGFVRPAHQNILIAADTIGELLAKMEAYQPHTPIFRMKAEEL